MFTVKKWTLEKSFVILLKFKQCGFTIGMPLKDLDRIDPDQTAPAGTVRSVSALFAQTCFSI